MRIPLLLLLGAASLSIPAAQVDFTYNTFDGIQKKYGNNRAETFSVAVFVGPELAGKKITGLCVPVYAQTDKVADISGWTSSRLERELIDKYAFNVPDGVTAAGKIGEDHLLRVTFDSPVTVPAEGIYVGYTYRATTKLSGTSVAVTDGNRKGECFFLSSRSKKTWTDLYEVNRMGSPLTVTMDGDFAADDASLTCGEAILGLDTKSFEATLVNNGSEPLKSIEYSYSTSTGISGAGSVVLSHEIPAVYGRGANVQLPLDNISESGNCDLTVTLTGVNGKSLAAGKKLATPLTAQCFVPVFRPIVEEYTYLTCGYCPRGYVMLEQMKSKYGSRCLGISYHSSSNERGSLSCIEDDLLPLGYIGSYPGAAVNRGKNIDPGDVAGQIPSMLRQTTTCDITGELKWSDDAQSQLTLTGKVRFLKDLDDHSYRIAYIILADGLSNTRWNQSNYYSSWEATGVYTEPFWDLFIGQPDHINNLVFNDIALDMCDYKGIEGSLPKTIEAGKEYEFSYTIDKSALTNIREQEIVSDYNRVRAIAMIVDGETGRAANSVSTLYTDGTDPFIPREDIEWTPVIEQDNEPSDSSVSGISCDAPVVKTVYYNVNGLRITAPAKGDMLIRADILENGAVKYSKIIF